MTRIAHSPPSLPWSSLTLAITVARGVDAQAPKRGGVLTLARQGEATNLDPHKVPAFTSHRVFELVYSTLTRLGPDLLVQPDLAESWTISPDGKQISFRLRAAKFHNGDPVTSADVKFTLERIVNPDTKAVARAWFADVDRDRGAGSRGRWSSTSSSRTWPSSSTWRTRTPASSRPKIAQAAGGDLSKKEHAIGSGPVPAGRVGAGQLHALRGVPRVLRPGAAVPRRHPDEHRPGRGRPGRRPPHEGGRHGADRRRAGRPDAVPGVRRDASAPSRASTTTSSS